MYLLYLFLVLLGYDSTRNIVRGLKSEGIVNGILAEEGEFNYVVAIMYRAAPRLPTTNPCAGAIVGNLYVATAAQCFYDAKTNRLKHGLYYIAVRVNDLNNPSPAVRYISVDKVIMHVLFNPQERGGYERPGNLAILKLHVGLALFNKVWPIAGLAIQFNGLHNYEELFFVSAFGYHEHNFIIEQIYDVRNLIDNGTTDGKLRWAQVKIKPDYDCYEKLSAILETGNMCAAAVRTDPEKKIGLCTGDIGAPLSHDAHLDGIAIHHFSSCDDEQLPAIYLNVSYYAGYIHDVVTNQINDEMYILKVVQKYSEHYEFVRIL